MLEKFEIIESVIHVFTLRDQFWVVRGFISISRQLTGGSSSDGRSELLPLTWCYTVISRLQL